MKRTIKYLLGVVATTLLISTTAFAKEETGYYGFAEDEVIIANTDVVWYTVPTRVVPANIGIRVAGVTNKGNLVTEDWYSDVFDGSIYHEYSVWTPAELTPVFNTAYGTQIDQATAYQNLIALKTVYPEGTPWTEANTYERVNRQCGRGCSAYAMQVSDLIFGVSAPIYSHRDVNNIKVGDILYLKGINHAVVALEVGDDYIVTTEGNYNGTVHWNWRVKKTDLIKWGTSIETRY